MSISQRKNKFVAAGLIIPLETKEGHEYLIKFNPLDPNVIPQGVAIPVIDIAIERVNHIQDTNNAKTLFQIAGIISNYMVDNDVILYCYCDSASINKRNPDLLNQEFRSLLFIKMFEKQNNRNYLNEQIIIDDPDNGAHYIHLFSRVRNKGAIDLIAKSLQEFNK
jgi:hypothetical protein